MKTKKEISKPQLYRCNSFIGPGCEGNPAGVCLLPAPRDEKLYRDIAVTMGCSETAFLYNEDGVFQLRWFTRAAREVDLCGHATLAASWVLWEKDFIAGGDPVNYRTRSGVLTAALKGQDIFMDFPVKPVVPLKVDEYPLAGLLGVKVLFMGKAWFDLLVEIDNEDDIKQLKPDFKALSAISIRGIIITARARSKEYDFVSRFFAPSIGIDEDPVTGSAHCALADYWSKKLLKVKMIGYQASPEGGIVGVQYKKDRVTLSGKVRETSLPPGISLSVLV